MKILTVSNSGLVSPLKIVLGAVVLFCATLTSSALAILPGNQVIWDPGAPGVAPTEDLVIPVSPGNENIRIDMMVPMKHQDITIPSSGQALLGFSFTGSIPVGTNTVGGGSPELYSSTGAPITDTGTPDFWVFNLFNDDEELFNFLTISILGTPGETFNHVHHIYLSLALGDHIPTGTWALNGSAGFQTGLWQMSSPAIGSLIPISTLAGLLLFSSGMVRRRHKA